MKSYKMKIFASPFIVFFSVSMGPLKNISAAQITPEINQTPIIQVTPNTTEELNEGYRVVREKKVGRLNVIEFLDKNKNVKLRLEHKYSRSVVGGLDHFSVQNIKQKGKYFLLTKLEEQKVSKDLYRKTGRERNTVSDLYVYDANGKIVFEKQSVPYQKLETVSDDGEKVACIVEAPDLIEEVDPPVLSNPPKAELFV